MMASDFTRLHCHSIPSPSSSWTWAPRRVADFVPRRGFAGQPPRIRDQGPPSSATREPSCWRCTRSPSARRCSAFKNQTRGVVWTGRVRGKRRRGKRTSRDVPPFDAAAACRRCRCRCGAACAPRAYLHQTAAPIAAATGRRGTVGLARKARKASTGGGARDRGASLSIAATAVVRVLPSSWAAPRPVLARAPHACRSSSRFIPQSQRRTTPQDHGHAQGPTLDHDHDLGVARSLDPFAQPDSTSRDPPALGAARVRGRGRGRSRPARPAAGEHAHARRAGQTLLATPRRSAQPSEPLQSEASPKLRLRRRLRAQRLRLLSSTREERRTTRRRPRRRPLARHRALASSRATPVVTAKRRDATTRGARDGCLELAAASREQSSDARCYEPSEHSRAARDGRGGRRLLCSQRRSTTLLFGSPR